MYIIGVYGGVYYLVRISLFKGNQKIYTFF